MLWIAQTARVLGDWCLRMFAVFELARRFAVSESAGWYLVTAVFTLPFIVLAPFNGAISNGLPKHRVLAVAAASSALVLLALLALEQLDAPVLIAGLMLVALGAAVFNPTRYALLPAVAEDTGLPLTRVNGGMELGAVLGILGGVICACAVQGSAWFQRPPALLLAIGASVLAALCALAADFPSDVRRPERPWQAMQGFFRDTRRVWGDSTSREAQLALASFLGLVTAGSGAMVMHALRPEAGGDYLLVVQAMLVVSVGTALGSCLAGWPGDLRRSLGFVPMGALGLLLALTWAAVATAVEPGLPLLPCAFLGFTSGLANVPLRAAYQAAIPADARGNGMAVANFAIYVTTTALSVLMLLLAQVGWLATPLDQLTFLAFVAAGGAGVVGWWLRREVGELLAPLLRGRGRLPTPMLTEASSSQTDEAR
ncbi:MAG: MFS transporter [Planctomycetia bacterium]|nr:MFS transporter [Planctomycetia bacterium]